ncbi:UNVERIFIED_CONTAM: hypothetical protein PYX00_006027 [Menopon gallinae]|uniref:Allatostatin-A n=1 Tax=Menopon gallinae TaxID=328185 RepID=A0AAW2HTY5_9NEOP
MEGRIPISLAIVVLGCFTFVSAFEEHRGKSVDAESDVDLDKRLSEYGKKPYHYMSEYKRLPLYNFGLGKRSPRYNFGLGKRYLEEEDLATDYDEYPLEEEEEELQPELYLDEEMQAPEKRQGPYSFGLGKRLPKYDFGLGKRAGPYDFGLGKRAGPYDFGLGKRTQRFNFGLGKRSGPYSFGLGKKAADAVSLGNRFSFGLGKREDADAEPRLYKREIAGKDLEDFGNRTETGNRHDLQKRSRNSAVSVDGFSRRFRKPFAYNFGLGKRRPLYDFGLGKRNYRSDHENTF